MAEKFVKISWLERTVLLLTVAFMAGTIFWFQESRPAGELQVETEHAAQEAAVAEKPEAPGMLEGEKIELNTASRSDLTRLPGIGETKAERILAWRDEHGGFASVEQLTEIKGIGEATLARLKEYVTVGSADEEGGTADGENTGGG